MVAFLEPDNFCVLKENGSDDLEKAIRLIKEVAMQNSSDKENDQVNTEKIITQTSSNTKSTYTGICTNNPSNTRNKTRNALFQIFTQNIQQPAPTPNRSSNQ